MSAKDPRRAFLVYLPRDLRRTLKALQAQRNARSLADTIRIELPNTPDPRPPFVLAHPDGRPVRLQLPKDQQARIETLARHFGLSPADVVLTLLMHKHGSFDKST